MDNLFPNILSFILNPRFSGIFLAIKIIFIIISILLFGAFVVFLKKGSWLKRRYLADWVEFLARRPYGAKPEFKQWNKIFKKIETKKEADYKLAVIEADNFFDGILAKIGYKGETMSDKLKDAGPDVIPNFRDVWEAHKIRNNVVHDPDYRLAIEQAQTVLMIYERALRDMEIF